ncbi:MAG TPA: alcohol dehydrogenase catalytic domain-containing protein, partial [Acidimicrobiales bacterium]|nr:alcohol dehydrogenase catalytic domain-containing protein [Acidimicrobiales bacterium]
MRAVQFDLADERFPASLVELPEPALPAGDWARVAVATGGICGSDLHLFAPSTGPSPALASMGSIPFVLGHETAGRVVEAGPDCAVALGTRVAVDPCIPCAARAIDPPCANCARGWTSSCLNLDTGVVSVGRTLGYTRDLGGGWCDQVVAHASMLHPLPEAVSDRGASLHEPVSIACHGLLRAAPGPGDPVLVVGAGIIGLATVAACKGLYPASPVTVLARHDHQAAAARACGADRVVRSSPDGTHVDELAALAGARVVGFKRHRMLMGGFPLVVEAVGAPATVTEALRAVAHRGTVLLLGSAGISEVDLTPVWYKEAALVGAIDHSVDPGPAPGLAGGPDRHSVD